jgi:hypothetical protein
MQNPICSGKNHSSLQENFAVTGGRRPNHVGLTRKYGCCSEIAIEPDLVAEESTAAMVLVS